MEVIGVDLEAIARGEDRIIFKETMDRIGVPVAKSEPVYSVEEAEKVAAELATPSCCAPPTPWAARRRASFTTWRNCAR